MRALIDGLWADWGVELIDRLVDKGVFTDIGDIKNPPKDTEVCVLFPHSQSEATTMINQIRKFVCTSPILVLWKASNDISPERDNVHYFPIKNIKNPEELIRVIKDTVRAKMKPDMEKIKINISTDDEKKAIIYNGSPTFFTGSEFGFLRLLMSKPWEVFTRDEIISAAESSSEDSKIVDVWLTRIRKKIAHIDGFEVETIRSRGFALKVTDQILLEGRQIKHIQNLLFDTMRGRLFAQYDEITRLHLTPRQIEIMEVLLASPGKTFTKEYIYNMIYTQAVQGEEVDEKIIDVFICKIRDNLGIHRDCVETHWGEGYSFNQHAYEKLVVSKRDFNAASSISQCSTWQALEPILDAEYDMDWLMYLKVLDDKGEVKTLIRIHSLKDTKTPNIEIFDSEGFRSIKKEEAKEIIWESPIERFSDFYEGVRGFLEIRNQDSLPGNNTWEHILKTVSRSTYWDGRSFRWYCEEKDTSVELLKVGNDVHVFVCEKDFYASFKKTTLENAATLFSGKYLKKLSISKTKTIARKSTHSSVKILTEDGALEHGKRIKTSTRFIEEMRNTPSLRWKFELFLAYNSPNYMMFFKVWEGTLRQKWYTVQFSRVASTEEIRIKIYDMGAKQLYQVSLEEAGKILEKARLDLTNVLPYVKQLFFQKGKPFTDVIVSIQQKIEQKLVQISIQDLKIKIGEIGSSGKVGILLTVFTKNKNGAAVTITALNFWSGIEYRVDVNIKGSVGKNFKTFEEVEAYCFENECSQFELKW